MLMLKTNGTFGGLLLSPVGSRQGFHEWAYLAISQTVVREYFNPYLKKPSASTFYQQSC